LSATYWAPRVHEEPAAAGHCVGRERVARTSIGFLSLAIASTPIVFSVASGSCCSITLPSVKTLEMEWIDLGLDVAGGVDVPVLGLRQGCRRGADSGGDHDGEYRSVNPDHGSVPPNFWEKLYLKLNCTLKMSAWKSSLKFSRRPHWSSIPDMSPGAG